MVQIYKPSPKGLRGRGPFGGSHLEPTDRFIFTGPRSAICYHAETGEVIEPFMFKSRDSYVTLTNETPPALRIPMDVWTGTLPRHQPELRKLAREYKLALPV